MASLFFSGNGEVMDNVDVFRNFEQFIQNEYKHLLTLGYVLKVVEEMPADAEVSFKQLYVVELPDERQTIFENLEVEYMFWAVVFYQSGRRLHMMDPDTVFRMVTHHWLTRHTYGKKLATHIAIAYALLVEQKKYFWAHRIYPINQHALVCAYLLNGE